MPSSDCKQAAKRDLRAAMKAQRATILVADRLAAADAIAKHGIGFAVPAPGCTIGAFMPIGEELSPLPLCAPLRRDGHRIALPRMIGRGLPLEFRLHNPGDPLAPAVWGIREPLPTAELIVPDVVLVALLAYDARGYRLGYGGGYYDRTLKTIRSVKKIITIGLAYDLQRVDAVPVLDYDEPLDWILTPSGPQRAIR